MAIPPPPRGARRQFLGGFLVARDHEPTLKGRGGGRVDKQVGKQRTVKYRPVAKRKTHIVLTLLLLFVIPFP